MSDLNVQSNWCSPKGGRIRTLQLNGVYYWDRNSVADNLRLTELLAIWQCLRWIVLSTVFAVLQTEVRHIAVHRMSSWVSSLWIQLKRKLKLDNSLLPCPLFREFRDLGDFAKMTGRKYIYFSSSLLVQPVKTPKLRATKLKGSTVSDL